MDFSRPGQAEQIWQQLQIEQNWEHHDRPLGQRFLGSIRISKQDSDQLLDITARNLSCVEPLTIDRLCDRFDAHDPQRYWIKIITLALSEYAYYDEGDAGFWQGVCDRLNLPKTQGVQSAFRAVLDQGFQLWGLVTTQQRNHYVSTLWLQSGIPQQNLRHFAQLLEELSGQYDWWDIAHADPEDLSQLLYEFCQEHHSQWGRLITFLKSSCRNDEEEIAPISGELLQGLAIVAQALERQGLEPTVLQDPHRREQLLQNFCLPNTFFLRNWDNLVRVLTPQEQNLTHRRNIISLRKKPLLLMLDIADSMDIQLCLPEQRLYQKEWKSLNRSHCKITEISWEGDIDLGSGIVEIPAKSKTVQDNQSSWTWYLQSHTNASLIEWRCEGVSPDFPVLFFDAWTGDRLVPSNELNSKVEIICFYDRTTQLELSDGIEVIDSFVPCSISGWRGQQLQLLSEQAQLTIRLAHSTKVIHWDNCQADYPQLRGLKLKRKDPVYLEVPSIWHPPVHLPKTISIQVEDLDKREILTGLNEQVSLPADSNWQRLILSKWINLGGNYAVKLWSGSDLWSEQFEVRSGFEVSQPSPISPIQVCDRENQPIETPIQVSSTSEFWLEELTLQDLWTLEEITFLLTNGQEKHSFVRQANSSGTLSFNLATLRDVLPESDRYSLSYQCQSEECYSLLEKFAEKSVSHTWAQQAINLSGLRLGQSYTLSLWNILRPEKSPLRLLLDKIGQENIAFPLIDSYFDTFGVFYVQLESPLSSSQSLGWWSNIQSTTNLELPDNFSDDLFEYCINLLGNEQIKDFELVVQQLNPQISIDTLKQAIASLDNEPYHFLDWLDLNLFHKKLVELLVIQLPKTQPELPLIPMQKNKTRHPNLEFVSINGELIGKRKKSKLKGKS